jgi:hypothetical protein
MGSTYTLRKGQSTLSDLKDGLAALNMGDGEIFYVDPGNGNDSNEGDSATTAFATLQAGINACVAGRGDVIFRLPGGEEVTQTVTFNKTGIYVKAVTYGAAPWAHGELFSTYAASTFTDGPAATITSRCTIDGLGFASRDTGATFYGGAACLIGGLATALPYGVHLINCRFPKWNLTNRIGLAIEGSSDCTIENCDFEGVGADFDSGIYVQGATQNLNIIGNHFRDCTYGVLFGAFAGGGPHVMMGHNVFEDSKVLSAASAATGLLYDNWCEGGTDTGSYNDTVDNLNTLGLVFSDQHYAE